MQITALLDDTLYSKKIINLLEEEGRKATRERYRTEVNDMYLGASMSFRFKERLLAGYYEGADRNKWNDFIKQSFNHDSDKKAVDLYWHKDTYTIGNYYRYFFDFKCMDIDKFIDKLMKSTDFGSRYEHHFNRAVYDVDQREFAVVPKGRELGATNIQQGVAVVIKGNKNTALAHVDWHTFPRSLEEEIIAAFPDDEPLHIRVYGPTTGVKTDEKPESLNELDKTANGNMTMVLETLKSLRGQGRNVNIASIQTNVSIEENLLKENSKSQYYLPNGQTSSPRVTTFIRMQIRRRSILLSLLER